MSPNFGRGCISIVLLALLVGCATATPYREAGTSGFGYATQQLENNRYRVTFAGNAMTGKATVRNYLLYRAAKVTLANGRDYFIVTQRDTERKVEQMTTSTGIGFGFGGPFSFGTVFVSDRDRAYTAFAVITIHAGPKPGDNPAAYDASEVVQNLDSTIQRPQ